MREVKCVPVVWRVCRVSRAPCASHTYKSQVSGWEQPTHSVVCAYLFIPQMATWRVRSARRCRSNVVWSICVACVAHQRTHKLHVHVHFIGVTAASFYDGCATRFRNKCTSAYILNCIRTANNHADTPIHIHKLPKRRRAAGVCSFYIRYFPLYCFAASSSQRRRTNVSRSLMYCILYTYPYSFPLHFIYTFISTVLACGFRVKLQFSKDMPL